MSSSPSLLRDRLDALVLRYDRHWLESDPLRWPRRYQARRDRELVAVIAALLAYGRVASIHRSVGSALALLGPRPADALAPSRRARLGDRLATFRHRFTAGADLAWLLTSVAATWDLAGSLGAFVGAHAVGAEPLRSGLSAWRRLADSVDSVHSLEDPVRRRARRFLLADPESGAACKRSLLLARWCVRPDDGLDLGLWSSAGPTGARDAPGLSPRDLLVPLDTHVHRVAVQVGLTRRRTADWRAAVEVTAGLAVFSPDDPVRYDFALARPGIVGRCLHRHEPSICGACDLAPCCRYGRPAQRARPAPAVRSTITT